MLSGDFACTERPGVLVVDDETSVRMVLVAGLRHMGFPVWQAASGLEAVRVHEEHQGQIHIALVDVRMPGLDGPATWALLHAGDSDLLCYFMTGDLGGYDENELLRRGAEGVILKPFPFRQLEEMLLRHPARVAGC